MAQIMSIHKKDGYVIEAIYPRFFYPHMTPVWLSTVMKFLGFTAPQPKNAFSYLELGCASGSNLLICAANYPQSTFVGIDFNATHIESAKAAADALELSNIEFIHADFAQFLASNTQQFDYIVQHGTYSWVATTQQQQILSIVKAALKPQGIFYLHYMCYPGSGQLSSIQKLCHLVDQAEPPTSTQSLAKARALCMELHQAGAFMQYPNIDAALATLQHNEAYLAHEFLTDHWQPLYSVDVHQQVYQLAGLAYVGSANPCDNLDSISIPQRLQATIHNTQAPALKEYLKDLARDAKQRLDLFQPQPQAYSSQQHLEQLSQTYFKLLAHAPSEGVRYFHTPIGQIQANQTLMHKLFAALAQRAHCFGELLQWPEFKAQPLFLIETLFLLMNAQYIHPYLDDMAHTVQLKKLEHFLAQHGLSLKIVPECGTAISTQFKTL